MDDSEARRDDAPLIPWDRLGDIVENRGWILALAIVLLGCGIRAAGLNAYWLNPDEGVYYSTASASFSEFWLEVQSNAHPPLYYLLLWGMDFVGSDVTWFRMLSLVPGCLAIFGVYLWGKEVGGAWVGLIAAFLTAVSPSAIELSQVMRPYMFQVAGLTYGLYFLARYVRTTKPRDLWLYSAFMVVALLTHYSSLIVMGGVGIVLVGLLVARKLPRSEVRRLVITHLPIGLTMLALSFHLSAMLNSDLQVVEAQTHNLAQHMIEDVGAIWPNFIGVMRYQFGLQYSGPTILLLLAGVILTLRRGDYAAFGLPIAVLGIAILAAALRQYPFGISRHVAYLLPIIAVPIAVPIAAGLAGGRRGVIATVVVVLGLLLFRGPVSTAIGAGSNQLLATEERIMPRDNVLALQQKLQQAQSSGRPILMGLQTYYSLIPLLDEARGEREWQPGGFFRIPWGQSVILVNIAWKMTTGAVPDGSYESFHGFLERIDGALPGLDIMEQTASTVLVAGWETGLVAGLLEFGSSTREDARQIAVVSDRGLLYLVAMDVDLEKFVDTVKE